MEKFKTFVKRGSAAFLGTGALVAANAHASVLDSSVTEALAAAKADGTTVGQAIIAAVVVVAVISIVLAVMRKA